MSTLRRKVNDPIHGLMELNERLFKIIDTPEFQRLRDLKQLGGNYFVFPGASHNRFEHCVGTCFLAGKWMRHLQYTCPVESITDEDVFLVEVAGLCHDLGHGPFSHTFEHTMKRKNIEWDHEEASCALLKLINDHQKVLSEEDLSKVQRMITGNAPENCDKLFMYRIVHNRVTGVDVDKFDYLQRDCYSASVPLGFNSDRLLQYSRINPSNHEICFNLKGAMDILQMFVTRYSLHKQVYSHHAVKGVELMIGDILFQADDYFGISKTIKEILELQTQDSPTTEQMQKLQDLYGKYAYFTDGMLTDIGRISIDSLREHKDSISKAKNLLNDLRSRKFYKFIYEAVIDQDQAGRSSDIVRDLQDHIEKHYPGHTDGYFIYAHSYDFGKKDENPIELVWFYSVNEQDAHQVKMRDISGIYSEIHHYREVSVRIFSKEEHKEEIMKLIQQYPKRQYLKWLPSPKGKALPNSTQVSSPSLVTSPSSSSESSSNNNQTSLKRRKLDGDFAATQSQD